MIISGLLTLYYWFMSYIISFLPTGTSFSVGDIGYNIASSAALLGYEAYRWNAVLPVDTLLVVLGIMLAIKFTMVGVRVSLWTGQAATGRTILPNKNPA